MRVGIFMVACYYGPMPPPGWPSPPGYFDRDLGTQSIEYMLGADVEAHALGFDFFTVAEHHYNYGQLSPAPALYAAALSQRIPGATVGILGSDLPLNNPVRVAEEFAELDHLTGGHTMIGLLRGTPNEYMTYGTNPWESRGRFEEGVVLIKKALTEPEPFGWEGKYYRYRTIAIWPHAYQLPHPPILISCSNLRSAAFAAEHHLDVGFEVAAGFSSFENIDHERECYVETAAKYGWTPTADNILCRQHCLVAESDEEAAAIVKQYNWPRGFGGGIAGPPQATEMPPVLEMIRNGMSDIPKGEKGVPTPHTQGPPLVGSPETVLRQTRELAERVGTNRMELIFTGHAALPQDVITRSIRLFGEEVLPTLHADPPVTLGQTRFASATP